ncbi:hypothetical protein NLI96_g3004 [Meripilus lineatus]|uniref:Uncharacterized protein n=1 Tax=Meripilus lineatus TaxID=2056292 RepID=A0AAD5YLA6_9APHY|nr:hypothetical protein NLI96_g3004 [Physisporinus lineatus]
MDVLGAQGITGKHVYDAATSFGHRSRFNLDDAFNDGDDNDDSLDFSPAAIRKELAKNMNHDQWGAMPDLDDFSSKIGYAVDDPDASVSTFDIDASLHDEPISPPTQQPPSPVSRTMSYISHSASLNDSQLASEFISVSLSDHHIPPADPEELELEQEPEPEVLPEESEQYAEYPSVQIDVSAEHPVAEVVSPKSVANSVYYTAPDAVAVAQQDGERIQSAPSDPIPVSPTSHRSESSLPMPTSLSLPSPTPHHTNASTSSVGTRHRPTKSLGPSALDKS